MHVLTLEKLAKDGLLAGKRVLIRSDLNAPHDENGRITNETRLVASVPAIRTALDAGAAVMVMSHLGRPTEGTVTPASRASPAAWASFWAATCRSSPTGLTASRSSPAML